MIEITVFGRVLFSINGRLVLCFSN